MPGRRPTPTQLKVVTGNPGRRPLNQDEPQPERAKPKAPRHLSKNARTAWRKVGDILDRMGVLTEADGFALERLCEIYAAIVEAESDIKVNGRYQTVITATGDAMERPRPVVSEIADLDRRFKGLLVEFGLTPASRSRVKVSSGTKKDPLDEYFG